MTKLYLVRHGEALGNKLQRFHGHTDSDITENGRLQLELLSERFKNIEFDVIFSSDLLRTKKTADAVNVYHQKDIQYDSKLREIHAGQWEDMSWQDIMEQYQEQYGHWDESPHLLQTPGGESMEEFEGRVVGRINEIVRLNEGKRICIVTHGTVMRVYQCYCLGYGLEQINRVPWCENTSITEIEYDNGQRPEIVNLNDDSHLSDEHYTVRKQAFWHDYNHKYGPGDDM